MFVPILNIFDMQFFAKHKIMQVQNSLYLLNRDVFLYPKLKINLQSKILEDRKITTAQLPIISKEKCQRYFDN